MSKEEKKRNARYVGKLKERTNQYGTFKDIVMDNLNVVNADGTPNKYYKGALLWVDSETGKTYQVKQMSLRVPREGMNPKLVEYGFTSTLSFDLESEYDVTPLD